MIKAVLLVTGVVAMCAMTFFAIKGGFRTLFADAIDMHAGSDYIKEKGTCCFCIPGNSQGAY